MTVRNRRRPGWMLIAAAATCTAGSGGMSAAEEPTPVYKDPEGPVDSRIDDLLARMTLEEKLAQLLTSVKATARVTRTLEQN